MYIREELDETIKNMRDQNSKLNWFTIGNAFAVTHRYKTYIVNIRTVISR